MSARQGIKGVIFGLVASFAALGVRASTYYVAPNGDDGAAGTEGAPLASLSVAFAKEDVTEVRLAAGDYDAMKTTANGLDDWLAIVEKPVAIYGADAKTTVLHCRADVSGHWSCGIHLNHADAELHGVTVTGVVRTDGGDNAYGIRIAKGKAFDCILTGNGNTTMQRNGVLLGLSTADAIACDCVVSNNVNGLRYVGLTDVTAGGVYASGNSIISNCTIVANQDHASIGTSIADLALASGTCLAIDCTIGDGFAAGPELYVAGACTAKRCTVRHGLRQARAGRPPADGALICRTEIHLLPVVLTQRHRGTEEWC